MITGGGGEGVTGGTTAQPVSSELGRIQGTAGVWAHQWKGFLRTVGAAVATHLLEVEVRASLSAEQELAEQELQQTPENQGGKLERQWKHWNWVLGRLKAVMQRASLRKWKISNFNGS